MQKLNLLVLLLVLIVTGSAVGGAQDGNTPSREQAIANYGFSSEVFEYAIEIADLMRKNSVYTNERDWNVLQKQLFESLRGMQSKEEVNRQVVLKWLRTIDNHSWFYRPKAVEGGSQNNKMEMKMPTGRTLPEKIAYVNIPYFTAGDPGLSTQFADTLHDLVRSLDQKSPRGWIIDLRENVGGNMYPMLTGMGAFYRERTIGRLVKADNRETSYYFYETGESGASVGSEEKVVSRLSVEPHSLKSHDVPIAVLVGPKTASAGEGLLVALLGLPNVRTFGQPTGGYVAANMPYNLSDGAMLGVAQEFFADIRGNVYSKSIDPHVGVEEAEENDQKDSALKLATLWISNR